MHIIIPQGDLIYICTNDTICYDPLHGPSNIQPNMVPCHRARSAPTQPYKPQMGCVRQMLRPARITAKERGSNGRYPNRIDTHSKVYRIVSALSQVRELYEAKGLGMAPKSESGTFQGNPNVVPHIDCGSRTQDKI